MFPTLMASSNRLTLEAVLARLIRSGQVDGIALFGSSAQVVGDSVSDYDLLLMLPDPPVHIFQMQTFINGRIADVAFVETALADRVLSLAEPVNPTSSEGYLIGWLERAKIVYDGGALLGRLGRIQAKLRERDWRLTRSDSEAYAEWFWLNFDLRHIGRLAASRDPI
jgi:predicted nucleotidyltransferase